LLMKNVFLFCFFHLFLISFGKNQILLLRSLYTIWNHISVHDLCRNSLCFLVCLLRFLYTICYAWFM
jgi:hypothetical protein